MNTKTTIVAIAALALVTGLIPTAAAHWNGSGGASPHHEYVGSADVQVGGLPAVLCTNLPTVRAFTHAGYNSDESAWHAALGGTATTVPPSDSDNHFHHSSSVVPAFEAHPESVVIPGVLNVTNVTSPDGTNADIGVFPPTLGPCTSEQDRIPHNPEGAGVAFFVDVDGAATLTNDADCLDLGDNDNEVSGGGGAFSYWVEPGTQDPDTGAPTLFGCGNPLGFDGRGDTGSVELDDASTLSGQSYTVCFDQDNDGICTTNEVSTPDAWDDCVASSATGFSGASAGGGDCWPRYDGTAGGPAVGSFQAAPDTDAFTEQLVVFVTSCAQAANLDAPNPGCASPNALATTGTLRVA